MFVLHAPFSPTGDQPQAIEELVHGIEEGRKNQVLLGVTGSGKTFTIANVIEKLQLPTLVISHNKTLAGQIYQEMREFFPENGVSYFVFPELENPMTFRCLPSDQVQIRAWVGILPHPNQRLARPPKPCSTTTMVEGIFLS